MKMKLKKCKGCGRVYNAVSRKYANDSIEIFNRYYDEMSDEHKQNYRGKASMATYDHCFQCGNSYTNFEEFDSSQEKSLYGKTINPILDSDEDTKD